jgi:hypothetical protein
VLEYVAARRPVLSIGEGVDVADTVIHHSGVGRWAATAAEAAHLLSQMYDEWRQTGYVVWRGSSRAAEEYSQKNMARSFARVLDSASLRR